MAKRIAQMVKKICPLAYEAFEDYTLNSAMFSAPELNAIKRLIKDIPSVEELVSLGLSKREAGEFIEKLK